MSYSKTMALELDHLFICTESGAPEAERLIELGCREGPPNEHPGQGTANRRFFFANAMLELLWVSDAQEAQNERTRRTQLWERWSGRHAGASPFGVCVRPANVQSTAPPFPAWEYRPLYLPSPLVMHIGDAGIEEPLWIYMDFQRHALCEARFTGYPGGMREITGVALTSPVPLRSRASQVMAQLGVLSAREGNEHLLEVEFDGHRRKRVVDCRPHLPLVFRL
jgi:hypothetical protein